MAARSGSEFLERLSAARVHVEIQGETLTGGVADHPAFRNVVRSYAELYDMQHDPAFRGRPGQAVPPGLGHLHLGLLRPPGAVRVLLLRRPGADGRRPRRPPLPPAPAGRPPR